jgi:hypothetical protein
MYVKILQNYKKKLIIIITIDSINLCITYYIYIIHFSSDIEIILIIHKP